MPEDRHDSRIPLEPNEVEHKGVDNFVGEGVLLVEENADEERVGSGVVHFGEFEEGGT